MNNIPHSVLLLFACLCYCWCVLPHTSSKIAEYGWGSFSFWEDDDNRKWEFYSLTKPRWCSYRNRLIENLGQKCFTKERNRNLKTRKNDLLKHLKLWGILSEVDMSLWTQTSYFFYYRFPLYCCQSEFDFTSVLAITRSNSCFQNCMNYIASFYFWDKEKDDLTLNLRIINSFLSRSLGILSLLKGYVMQVIKYWRRSCSFFTVVGEIKQIY